MTGARPTRRATGAILALALLALGALGGGAHATSAERGLVHDPAGHEVHPRVLAGADGRACATRGLHVEGSRPAPHRDCPVCLHARGLRLALDTPSALAAERLVGAGVALPAVAAASPPARWGAGPRGPPLA